MRAALLSYCFVISLAGAEPPPPGYQHALDLYNHTDYTAAVRILRALPQTAPTLELTGRCYLMDAEYKLAVEVLEKAVLLDPENSMTLTWLGRAEGRRAQTSIALAAIPHANKARESLEKAVRLDPRNKDALDDLFEYYIQAPGFMGGGFGKAEKLLPLMAQLDPAEVSFAQGRIAERQKDFSAAEAYFRLTAAHAPRSVGRLLDLARFLAKRNRTEDSEIVFAQAARLAPNAARVRFARAELWIQSGRNLPQARELLQKYIASANLTPDDPSRPAAEELLKKTGAL